MTIGTTESQQFPIYRGQIYFVNLDPVVRREIGGGKSRPVVVVSINDLNLKDLVVTVVPGTSAKRPTRFRSVVEVTPSTENGLSVPTHFQAHQVRSLDHSRFPHRPAGTVARQDLARLERALAYTLGISLAP